MTALPGATLRTTRSQRSRRLLFVALALPALLLAALLAMPGSADAGIVVSGPDLSVAMSDDPDPVSPGGTVTFTIVVSNTGSEDSVFTQLDFSTDGASVLGAQVTGGSSESCTVGVTTASCDLGTVPTSSTVSVGAIAPLLAAHQAEVLVDVEAPDAPGTEFLSSATATSGEQSDQNPADNSDTELTNVSEFESRSGIVPPGGSLTTLDGPLNADDPFAVALKNISTQPLVVTIEEEPCDGTQEGDPLCSTPRVGGVAGDFIFEPSGSETLTTTTNPAVVVARLYYDVSLLQGVTGVRIFWQKTPGGEVRRLPRCDDGKTVQCWVKEQKSNGDQIIRIKLRQDPRITRG